MNIQQEDFCVQHLSTTAIRTYLTDRQAFKKRFILLQFEDFKPSPALVEGKIFHAIIESYWASDLKSMILQNPEEHINRIILGHLQENCFANVDFGKTGSEEKSIEIVRKLSKYYFEALPKLFPSNIEILGVEKKLQSDFQDLEGNPMPIPLKGFIDLIYREKSGDIVIVDHKSVSSFSTHEDFIIDVGESFADELGLYQPAYELQAAVYWLLCRMEYGVNPKRMEFHQIKKSTNKDGGEQFYVYKVDFNPKMIKRFITIYERIVQELSGKPLVDEATGIMQFLPNPFQQFGWIDSWLDFCLEIDEGSSCTLKQTIESRRNDANVEALDL